MHGHLFTDNNSIRQIGSPEVRIIGAGSNRCNEVPASSILEDIASSCHGAAYNKRAVGNQWVA